MSICARELKEYHVFLASPGDVSAERQHVRQFFERYNRLSAELWNVRFEVVDWENYSTIGVGRPQELITAQTLQKYRQSLVLVIGIMGQRFGSPTGEAESGTEEEFNWAMEYHKKYGYPEIKWFFRKIQKLEIPTDLEEARKAIEQWEKVLDFRRHLQDFENPVFYTEYQGQRGFRDVFESDLNRWLADASRPWVFERASTAKLSTATLAPPSKYYESTEREFSRLDIAGIDNDRTFEIPLSEIYVRLRVMFDEDTIEETKQHHTGGPIDIQTALRRYQKLVIVGDPGSGKSTFLKYIALMLARSFLTGNSGIALEKLCLPEPLPIPIFLSCWDLADFLREQKQARLNMLIQFIARCLTAYEFSICAEDVDRLLGSGNCCLMFDGLDEVPTDAGRATLSRLLEECVELYSANRYIITSRIRAYTGDTILKGEFTRCDIQPFDADDRAEFIRNWIALLFRVPPEDVQKQGGEAHREFNSLTHGIEASDRIRQLAINPLLLTVIAIVHWNRKRLPEQRVDLYEECVDVLLGQRKEAEHILISRKGIGLDEQREEQVHEERAWVRKRFAEIALHILCQNGERDEATKADLIELLVPRFIDRGAANKEQAAARAEWFLDRQELRSGLLVSRRTQSYRFVHLTFQEYLAAWQLSNMDFDKVAEIIESRLRLAKWFETLQLLGSRWAKESDEEADRFIAWLLDNCGSAIIDRAPVVALCANIVKDITGIAELRPKTRSEFKKALETTLDAFREGSGIAPKTQLEILEALGQLGAAVKSHLIDATKAGLFQVRCRAIEMLLPHLSDSELFSLVHILNDRSREPVYTYFRALLDRNEERAVHILIKTPRLSEKCSEGIWSAHQRVNPLTEALDRLITTHISIYGKGYPQGFALCKLADRWPDENTQKLLIERAMNDEKADIRHNALQTLAEKWPDESTRKILSERAVNDENSSVRSQTLQTLVEKWPDENTRKLLTERAVNDESSYIRRQAVFALAEKWPSESTRKLLTERAVNDENSYNRCKVLGTLAEKWPDENTRKLLTNCAVQDENSSTRSLALHTLAEKWPDENTRKLLTERTVNDKNVDTRSPNLILCKKRAEKAIQ